MFASKQVDNQEAVQETTTVEVHKTSTNNEGDEELAASTSSNANEDANKPTQEETRSSRSLRCTPFRVVFVVIIVSAAIAVGTSGAFKGEDSETEFDIFDPSTWIPRWLDDNPHGGNTPYDFSLWDNYSSCRGLQLDVVNNLDSKWEPYFQQSIDDWENGSPDVLTLRVRKSIYNDPNCEPMDGVMKVCNGDYGSTKWIGINNVVIQFNFIISSVAKLNDYYLDKMSNAAKQNTMCHELGHGFGLGHWDESFTNRNLGNCMDYTEKPETNQKPDTSNFLFLERMYGNVKGTSRYVTAVNGTEGLHCSSVGDGENIRQRRLDRMVKLHKEEFSQYARVLASDTAMIAGKSEGKHPMAHLGWRYLKRNDYEEVHEKEFGNGVKIVSTIRLA